MGIPAEWTAIRSEALLFRVALDRQHSGQIEALVDALHADGLRDHDPIDRITWGREISGDLFQLALRLRQ